MDPSEWPEMRDYVSPQELDAYAALCKAATEADEARGGKAIGGANLPPAPRRETLSLNDLAAAEEARAGLQPATFASGGACRGLAKSMIANKLAGEREVSKPPSDYGVGDNRACIVTGAWTGAHVKHEAKHDW